MKKQKSHSCELICELDFSFFASKNIYFYVYIWYDYYVDNMIVSKGRGYVMVYCTTHVFCTKYRKKILTNSIKDSLFQIIILLSEEMDFKIIEINTDLDYIHLLISCKPRALYTYYCKKIKRYECKIII